MGNSEKVENKMDLDDLVKSLGGCGGFQVRLCIATYSVLISVVCGMLMMVFGAYNPGWQCLEFNTTAQGSAGQRILPTYSYLASNTSTNNGKNGTNDTMGTGALTSTCDILPSCERIVFEEGTSTIVTEWGLICERAWIPGIIFTIQMSGVLVGAYLSGIIGDRYGRKVCLYGFVAYHGVLNAVTIFSVSWKMFATLRFFIGIGIGGTISTSFMYPFEFISQSWRGIVGAIPVWNICSAIFSVAVLLLRDWKLFHAFNAVMCLISFLMVFWTPESMRWLAVRGNVTGARRSAKKMARINRRELPSIEVFNAIVETEKTKNMSMPTYTFIDLFKHNSLTWISIKMGLLWISMGTVYFGISFGIKSLSGNFYINLFLFSLAELPGNLFVAPLGNKLGRRPALAIHYFASCLASFTVVVVFFQIPNSNGNKTAVISGLALFAKAALVGAWSLSFIITMESYPTVVRSLGNGYVNAVARIGGMISPFLFPDNPNLLWLPFLIVGIVLLFDIGIVTTLPETLGKPMADTLEDSPNKMTSLKLHTLNETLISKNGMRTEEG